MLVERVLFKFILACPFCRKKIEEAMREAMQAWRKREAEKACAPTPTSTTDAERNATQKGDQQ